MKEFNLIDKDETEVLMSFTVKKANRQQSKVKQTKLKKFVNRKDLQHYE